MPHALHGAQRLEALQQVAASPLSSFQAKLMLSVLINEGKQNISAKHKVPVANLTFCGS